jgi:hypothetical protein
MKSPKQKPQAAKRKTHSLELKLQVLQQLNAGAAVSDVLPCVRAGGDHGGAVATGVRPWRVRALFPKLPGPAKREQAAEDPRREADRRAPRDWTGTARARAPCRSRPSSSSASRHTTARARRVPPRRRDRAPRLPGAGPLRRRRLLRWKHPSPSPCCRRPAFRAGDASPAGRRTWRRAPRRRRSPPRGEIRADRRGQDSGSTGSCGKATEFGGAAHIPEARARSPRIGLEYFAPTV